MAKRSQVIVDDYLRRIVSGEMAEGQLLPTETALIEQYEVSRTAVREAIQTLATKGFVLIRQGSGSTVAPRLRWNVLDSDYLKITGFGEALFANLLETRDILEPAIAGLAAERTTPEQLERLRQLVTDLAEAGHKDATVHADLDIAFHHLLAECTGNPVLISLHGSISHLSRAQRQIMVARKGAVERAIFWHQHIVEAIATGDAAAGRDAMRMHLRQVHTDLDATLLETALV
ncbi:MAG: GntR family transcriptional regulator, transcriptional repressor for pyruvate dehydrogenase complex [Pseudonocardiales bacterium]|nr:GntR family transcriptional regulator, transcriptional repressor for pyruvate dehydrogenase complex [Pseudonocardiales bacterium]